jgi:hypothetical protein
MPVYGPRVLIFALVSDEIGAVIDFYATREEAEAELRDALSDEPEWKAVLRVEPFELETSPN